MHSHIIIWFCCTILFFWAPSFTEGARILFLGAMGSKSHRNSIMPLIEELGKRGHTVISVTHTKNKKPLANVTEVLMEEMEPLRKKVIEVFMEETESMKKKEMPKEALTRSNDGESGIFSTIPLMKNFQVATCKLFLSHTYIKRLIEGKEPRPDLIVSVMLINDCNMAVVHRLGVPLVHFSPGGIIPWSLSNLRIANDITYCPQIIGGDSDRIDFMGRITNGLQLSMMTLIQRYYWMPAIHDVMKQHLGEDIPSAEEIEKNYSLILINSHFAFDFPRPATPNLINVGGMHLKKSQPLPQDLEDWMTGAGKDGVVYFSLGSSFAGSLMPEEFRLLFIDAFSRIPQRVLWKWEKDEMPGLPKNVKISKWFPQQDILGHPNLKVFITHGGLLSTMETTYHGVPVIGIPIAGDQVVNMKKTDAEGAGIMLTWATITADKLIEALNEVINNPIYKERVQHRASIAQDMDIHPKEKAAYWLEYVIRHKGAYHLQHGSMFLSDFQYYMIDMYLLLNVVILTFFTIIILSCRWSYKKLCKAKVKTE